MPVLFLSTWFPYPPDNGSKLRVYHLLRALARAHTVTLIAFTFDTARPDEPGDLSELCAAVHAVPLDPFAVNRAGALQTFLSPRPMASRSVPAMSALVADVIASDVFDVVIASTEMMADYALLAPPTTARILEEHNSMARWMRDRHEATVNAVQRTRSWVSWQKTRRYEASLFRRFDLVTMVSEQDRSSSLALPGYRGWVEVVPNGVDCRHNRPDLARPRPNALVYNGALTYSANYDAVRWFMAEIYPRIGSRRPDVSLTITGATKGVDLGGLALDASVHLTGYVEDIRLPVAEAAVCIVPIRQGGGTRVKILEAMALGTPVVATSKGAEGLDVVEGEHLLLADTPAAFSDAVLRAMGDSALRERLRRNARTLVETRYDWEMIGARFVGLLEETVEAHRQMGRSANRQIHKGHSNG